MKRAGSILAVSLAGLIGSLPAMALPVDATAPGYCALPSYLTLADSPLHRVTTSALKAKTLKIVVLGTGSSQLAFADGRSASYPARLELALQRRLPTVAVTVVPRTQTRQTAAEMAQSLDKMLAEDKPSLVIWQTGTSDAMRGVDPGDFRESVATGVEKLQASGADVILMNMQYSPRTETIIAAGGYNDGLRWVSREREVPLFDRSAIMRYWNDTGALDLYGGSKDATLAKRVHDCIGRAMASMIIEAGNLESLEGKASQ